MAEAIEVSRAIEVPAGWTLPITFGSSLNWPNVQGDGSLLPFTTDQLRDLNLQTKDIRDGAHPTIEKDSKGCSVRRQWFCDWTQRDNALAAILGAATLAGTSPNWTLSRVMPQIYPDPGYGQYIALAAETVQGARSAGKDDARTVPAYKSAELVIRYELVFWPLAPDGVVPEYNRYVEQLPSTTESSYLTIPGSMMKYRTQNGDIPDATLIPFNVGRVELVKKISYKWHRLPYEAWYPGSPLFKRVNGDPSNTTVNAAGRYVGYPYIGCVNRTDWLGYPAGTLLFDGVDEEIVPDPVRNFPCWNLTLRFLAKQNMSPNRGGGVYGGHNYLYYGGRASDGQFAGYYFASKGAAWIANGSIPDGVCLYNERELLNLFAVGAVADANV